MHHSLAPTIRLALAALCAATLPPVPLQAQDHSGGAPSDQGENSGHGGQNSDHGQGPGSVGQTGDHGHGGGPGGQNGGHGSGPGGQTGDHGHGGPGRGHGGFPGHGFRPGYGRPGFLDRNRAGWWRSDARFVGYRGGRPGYYFAPGYGYYPIPLGYADRTFVAGMVLPVAMRGYVVVEPGIYGLRLPPPGFGWYYAGNSFVLASVATGMIAQAVAGGW